MLLFTADMLKCQSFPSVALFIQQSTGVEDAASAVSVSSSSAASSSDDMGLGQLVSSGRFISRSDFMDSATSILKAYIKGSLLENEG